MALSSILDRLTLPMALSFSAVLLLCGMAVALAFANLRGTAIKGTAPSVADAPADSTPGVARLRQETRILSRRIDDVADQVNSLAARNRLLTARFQSLESDFGTVTGSIDLMARRGTGPSAGDGGGAADRTSGERRPEGGAAQTGPPRPDTPGAGRSAKADMRNEVGAQASPAARKDGMEATRTRFALKLASYSEVEGLRRVWDGLMRQNAALLAGLQPRTVLREEDDDGVRIDLVAGPIANAGEAAEICAKLASKGVACEPATFEGEPLKDG